MQDYWWWWGLAVLLGVAEMVTSTFYLLVLGLGFAAGGLVAYLGGGIAWQLLAAALVSVAGWALLRRHMPARSARRAPTSDRNVLLDVGERVHVDRWDESRRTQVMYRGAPWAVELAADVAAAGTPGDYVIRSIESNRLVVAPER
jgi:membrane protein implicated in regulation of membrane protease activity